MLIPGESSLADDWVILDFTVHVLKNKKAAQSLLNMQLNDKIINLHQKGGDKKVDLF